MIETEVSNLDDFYLGGRKIGPWMSAFSYGTTYFSAVIFIGYAGSTGWNFGLPAVLVGIGNALIGSLFAWLVLAIATGFQSSMAPTIGVIAMASSLLLTPIVSLFTKPYKNEHIQHIFKK